MCQNMCALFAPRSTSTGWHQRHSGATRCRERDVWKSHSWTFPAPGKARSWKKVGRRGNDVLQVHKMTSLDKLSFWEAAFVSNKPRPAPTVRGGNCFMTTQVDWLLRILSFPLLQIFLALSVTSSSGGRRFTRSLARSPPRLPSKRLCPRASSTSPRLFSPSAWLAVAPHLSARRLSQAWVRVKQLRTNRANEVGGPYSSDGDQWLGSVKPVSV